MFVILLTTIVSASNQTKCVSLSNKNCMTRHTFINLHPNKYSQQSRYYPFVVNLNRCIGSCNTLGNLSRIVCFPNEREDLNLLAFYMLTGVNESRILTKHISCKYKFKFHSKTCKSNRKSNNY